MYEREGLEREKEREGERLYVTIFPLAKSENRPNFSCYCYGFSTERCFHKINTFLVTIS